MPSSMRRYEGRNPKVSPKTVSLRQLQDNITVIKNSIAPQIQMSKIKTMATTQKFKKIL